MQLGLAVRVIAGCVAGSFFVAMVAGVALIPLFKGGGYPEPFALIGHVTRSGDLATWLWQGAALVAVVLFGGRALAVATAASGWMVLPQEHRALLGRIEGTPAPAAPPAPEAPVVVPRTVNAPAPRTAAMTDSYQESVHR